MKETLYNLFKVYRFVPPIVAHQNVRMRGQAFVTFPDVETANRARKEVADFPLYGKPMVCWGFLSPVGRVADRYSNYRSPGPGRIMLSKE
jgi:hypothetical protein